MSDHIIATAAWLYEHWSGIMLSLIAYCSWCCTLSLAHIYAHLVRKGDA